MLCSPSLWSQDSQLVLAQGGSPLPLPLPAWLSVHPFGF